VQEQMQNKKAITKIEAIKNKINPSKMLLATNMPRSFDILLPFWDNKSSI
jgi:hypothetical protein